MSGNSMRGVTYGCAFFAFLILAPLVAQSHVLAVLTLVLQYALLGMAWNLMMGFAGQLSLGHALFLGIGGYTAAVLSVKFGVNPWLGMIAGAALSSLVGAVIGYLGFRFAVRGVYFALLTIAFAELFRIVANHWEFIGKAGGFFLRAPGAENVPLETLRGGSEFHYYFFLGLTALGLVLTAALRYSRIGYLWLAIREDEEAARSLGVKAFRIKVLAVVISAAVTSLGGTAYAFLNGSLFPDTVFGMSMSIEILIGPVMGGVGTLFGPIIGAFFVIPLAEGANYFSSTYGIAGLNTLVYGLVIMIMIKFMPGGIWPPIAERIGFRTAGQAPVGIDWSRLLRRAD